MKNFNATKSLSLHRRKFIKQTGLLATSAFFIPFAFDKMAKQKFKMGLQLFTMRADMAKDAVGSLKKIAAIGYEDLETYGYDPLQNKYYGLTAADFKKVLENNNLT